MSSIVDLAVVSLGPVIEKAMITSQNYKVTRKIVTDHHEYYYLKEHRTPGLGLQGLSRTDARHFAMCGTCGVATWSIVEKIYDNPRIRYEGKPVSNIRYLQYTFAGKDVIEVHPETNARARLDPQQLKPVELVNTAPSRSHTVIAFDVVNERSSETIIFDPTVAQLDDPAAPYFYNFENYRNLYLDGRMPVMTYGNAKHVRKVLGDVPIWMP
ncbi:hypothetical protein HDV00_000488 [Rhizophlyctis rosea]|nr:hypothetical protein HDV00_000488 [Rhizophlyctis rosea]